MVLWKLANLISSCWSVQLNESVVRGISLDSRSDLAPFPGETEAYEQGATAFGRFDSLYTDDQM
jgi:hypothetical protein